MVRLAATAPSIHNAQPARWRSVVGGLEIAADLSVRLPQADPEGAGVALSVGAAVEATVLALSRSDVAAEVTPLWAGDDARSWPGHRMAARLTLSDGAPLPLADQLEARFTWRGRFETAPPRLFGWTRGDTVMVLDEDGRGALAALNDEASLRILRGKAFRQELLGWMRLTTRHPRYRFDGLSRAALRLSPRDAKSVKLGLGPLWPLLDWAGRAEALVAEAPLTMSAPLIALFHAPRGADPMETGRGYLRMWLEATALGLAGWPMAALSDDAEARAEVEARFPMPEGHRLVQALRFGVPTGDRPPRFRRAIEEVLSDG